VNERTDRKGRSEGAGRDDDHYRLLVASTTDFAIYMPDPEGFVISWNAGAERFKGYTADEIKFTIPLVNILTGTPPRATVAHGFVDSSGSIGGL